MPALAELQQRMAAAILAPTPAPEALADIVAGAVPAAAALRVHRNTVAGALANALRLACPAVEKAVGSEYFDQLAADFGRGHPPNTPALDGWGAEFADYLAALPSLAAFPWLPEVARFDTLIERLGRAAPWPEQQASHRQVSRHAVDELRDALLAEDADAVARLACPSAPVTFLLRRAAAGVLVSREK